MTSPGIYRSLPFSEYQAIDALNPSLALHMRNSPLEMNYYRTHPKPETTGMRLGTLIHQCVLEPELFQSQVVVWNGAKRGKPYNDFCDENEGKTIVTQADYDTCLNVCAAVHNHPASARYVNGFAADDAESEVSLVWNDYHTGLLCKTRIDLLTPGVIIDLKTTKSSVADEFGLRRTASTFGYHIAMGARQDAVNTLAGHAPDCKLIFVEQNPPHDVVVKTVNDAVLSQGQDRWYQLLGRIAECERNGVWPGYDSGESNLNVWLDEIE